MMWVGSSIAVYNVFPSCRLRRGRWTSSIGAHLCRAASGPVFPVVHVSPASVLLPGCAVTCYLELMTIRRIVLIAAWVGLALVILVTASPIGARPTTVTTTDLDRAAAFALLAALFVIAYPKHVLTVLGVLFVSAFFIELVQFVSVTRHPEIEDALIKALGVVFGSGLGACINLLLRRRAKSPGARPG